ncbi:hypothetical protein ACHAPJ_009076 [Fusarium lateritium]
MVRVTKIDGAPTPIAVSSDQVRNHGHISDHFDPADKPYYYSGPPINNKNFDNAINLWDSNPAQFQPVYDQGDTNSCTANATAAAVRFLIRKLVAEQPGIRGNLSDVHDVSRLFIYYVARAYGRMEEAKNYSKWPVGLTDTGCRIRNAFKTTKAYGIIAESEWPWKNESHFVLSINDRPFDSAFESNELINGIEYCRLDPDHAFSAEQVLGANDKTAIGTITLFRLRQCLYEGYPVVFAFKFYWKNLPTTTLPGDQFPSILGGVPNTLSTGSHAVLAVAYDHAKQRVLIQNSWGPKNPNAHFWMPYEWIKSFEATEDFWMVRTKQQLPAHSSQAIDRSSDLGLAAPWTAVPVPGDKRHMSQAHTATIASLKHSEGAEFWYATDRGSLVGSLWSNQASGSSVLNFVEINVPVQPLRGIVTGRMGIDSPPEATWRDRMLQWITQDGTIMGTCYTENLSQNRTIVSSKSRSFFELKDSETSGLGPAIGLAAVTSPGSGMDFHVFWADKVGALQGYRYKEGFERLPVAPAGTAWEKSCISALRLTSSAQTIWCIGPQGQARGFWCRSPVYWTETAGWISLPISNLLKDPIHLAALESRVALTNPISDGFFVFWVTRRGTIDGLVCFDIWQEWTWELINIAGAPPARVDSDIRAVSFTGEHIAIFWVGPDNSLESAVGIMHGKNTVFTFERIADAGAVAAGSPLGVVLHCRQVYVAFKDFNGHYNCVTKGI